MLKFLKRRQAVRRLFKGCSKVEMAFPAHQAITLTKIIGRDYEHGKGTRTHNHHAEKLSPGRTESGILLNDIVVGSQVIFNNLMGKTTIATRPILNIYTAPTNSNVFFLQTPGYTVYQIEKEALKTAFPPAKET